MNRILRNLETNFIVGLLSAAAMFGMPQEAPAQPQSKLQQGCIVKVNKAGASVFQTSAQAVQKCVQDGAKGTLDTTIEECIDADRKGKVASKRAKHADTADRACTETPTFGQNVFGVATDANTTAPLLLAHDLLGANLDVDTPDCDTEKEACKCRITTLKRATKYARALYKAFNRCKKGALVVGKAPFPDGASGPVDLRDCLDDDATPESVAADSAGKLAAMLESLAKNLDKQCTDIEASSFDSGACAGLVDENLTQCVGARARCSACEAIKASDALPGSDCDLFDDGVANDTCSPAGLVVGPTYASPTGSATGTCDFDDPCTLHRALARVAPGFDVRVAGSVFEINEPITSLGNATAVSGGWVESASEPWVQSAGCTATTVRRVRAADEVEEGRPGLITLQLADESDFRLECMRITTQPPTHAGGSAYALHMSRCSDYSLRDLVLRTNGAADGAAGDDGLPGNPGWDAGAPNFEDLIFIIIGATDGDGDDENFPGLGGIGGWGGGITDFDPRNGLAPGQGGGGPGPICCNQGDDGSAGETSISPLVFSHSPVAGGGGGGGGSGGQQDKSGGRGGRGGGNLLCPQGETPRTTTVGSRGAGGSTGEPGGDGTKGERGLDGVAGGDSTGGAWVNGFWENGSGASGTAGCGGAGGSGGGGGGGQAKNQEPDGAGNGGGGGGGGGRGGSGGQGGQDGGSNVALYLFENGPGGLIAASVNLQVGDPGAGGLGGLGGQGGAGGKGALGASADTGDVGAGGKGGNGGRGGDGGPGGAGAGGEAHLSRIDGGIAPVFE